MDTTITSLAASAVAALAPYLAKAGEEFAREAGKGALEKIGALYDFLKKRFQANPNAKGALDDLKANPDDEDAQAALRVQIKKLMKADPTIVKTVQQMLSEIKQDKGSVSFLTQVYGGNVDKIINIGTAGTVNIN
jgi:hypothetical protein